MKIFNLLLTILSFTAFASVNSIPLKQVELQKYTPSNKYDGVKILEEVRKTPFTFNFQFLNSFKCFACKTAASFVLWKFRTPEGTYPGLADFIANKCILFGVASEHVCNGMISAMEDEVLYVLEKLQLSGEDVCGLVLPATCTAPDLSWNQKWLVDLPPKPSTAQTSHKQKREKSDEKQLRVVQISDLHVDLMYKDGSEADCGDPLCCRKAQSRNEKVKNPAGYWGTKGKCDTPYRTVDHLLSTISQQEVDYIIWTGDLPPHDDWEQTRDIQLNHLQNLTDQLLHHLPGVPVYPSLGNHESFPVNSFPPRYIEDVENNISWLYDKLAQVWSPWLPADSIETVKKFGYYTVLVRQGLRIVSINMNYCNDLNFWTLMDAVDPDNHLRWLVDVLHQAESNNETVHILGHIPPAVVNGDCVPVWRNNYYRIVNRFKNIITGQFFGHTHTDEFEVMYSGDNREDPIGVVYVAPSVTTFEGLNPSYRVYEVSSETYEVSNHHTFVMNLTTANRYTDPSQVKWDYLYDAKRAYKMTDLSNESWHALYASWTREKITAKANNTFQAYYRNYYRGDDIVEGCDMHCRMQMTCNIAVGNFSMNCAT